MKMGIPESNVFILDLGQVVETDSVDMKIVGSVPAGRVLVDGLGVGDVGSVVLKDRKKLATDGLIIVVASIERETGVLRSGPEVVSRGFVYVRESELLMEESRNLMKTVLETCLANHTREWGIIKANMKDKLSDFIYEKTGRSPMILPVIMEIRPL